VNVTITEPANSLSGTTTQTNVTCNGLGDGSITLTPSGGTSSYSYSWTGPGTYTSSSQSPSGLAAGTYTYKITDSKGCTSSSSATISEPSILKLVLDDQKNVDCNGNSTGSVKLSATGGSPSYTYSLNSGTFGTATAFSSLSAGSYQFNVKDKNGCVDKFTIQITEPGALIVTATVTDVSCDGGNDGVIKGAATGGTASYQYKLGSAGVWQNSVTFNKLSKGTYTLYVRDTNLCVASSSVSVSESVVMSAQLDVNSAVNLCEGSTHYFSSSRSTITSGSYSVDWDFGDAATASGNSVSHKYSKPGTYTVTMRMVGSTGCKKIKSEIVKVYPMPTVLFCPIDVKGNCTSSQCLRGNDFNFNSFLSSSCNKSKSNIIPEPFLLL
jgi:chitodextrinase